MMQRDAMYVEEMSGYVAYEEHLYSEITDSVRGASLLRDHG
jgi:hypothetical protein